MEAPNAPPETSDTLEASSRTPEAPGPPAPPVSVLDLTPTPPQDPAASLADAPPDWFHDLHLDDIEAALTAGREDFELRPFFRSPLTSRDAIVYRHEVFRDLERPEVRATITAFAERMAAMRGQLARANKVHVDLERQRWLLDAAGTYQEAVERLQDGLAATRPDARGLRRLGAFLETYVAGPSFADLGRDISTVRAGLDGITYRLAISGGQVRVSRYEHEPDYGAHVLATFERFSQGATERYMFRSGQGQDMNHVEAEILERVALLYPAPFAALRTFCADHTDFLDPTVARFDREVQFYLAYLEYLAPIRAAGLAIAYPEIDEAHATLDVRSAYDLALASLRVGEGATVVPNDLALAGPERIIVVSGPNQGGKTTFARTVGQLHHLALVGCPVAAASARLPLVDRIFTHFEREEDLQEQSGKLEDDLRRIHRILDEATSRSLLVINESFASTTLQDALFLSTEVLRSVIACGLWCVTVTFLDELASLGPETVSMVSSVDPDDPTRRTFKVIRRPADGLAYAMAVAEKHGLTYAQLTGRRR
ncbi:MAG TPA: hypothetical protein VFW92_11155 [Candidatus Limnocylindrales bacterium]|nr:hypothetical protein [Candidatus Limnocylindrales bacterium]